MQRNYSVDDLILNYDPEHPQERFRQAGLEAAMKSSTGRLPGPVPWPQGHAPTAAPLAQPPAESDDLSRFHGYDAVVVTWTAAEAAALAVLFAAYAGRTRDAQGLAGQSEDGTPVEGRRQSLDQR